MCTKMTDEIKELIKKIVVENFCCEDCKEIGVYDECFKQGKDKSCEEFVSDLFDEIME